MIGVPLFLSLLLAAGPAVPPTVSFRIDPSATGAHDQPLYVDDGTLKSSIPDLRGAGERLSTCINPLMFPPQGYIEFAPTVTGVHSANSNRLLCALSDHGTIQCHELPDEDRRVVFDKDASNYFHLGEGTDLQQALEIVRAFAHGHVQSEDGSRLVLNGLPLRDVAREGDHFKVGFDDCGCTREMSVTRQRAAGRWIVSGKIIRDLCV